MKELIQQTIELLKLKVKSNLEQIKDNQLEINELLKEPISSERTRLFDERYDVNKKLLSENNDFINMQLSLTRFLEKYKNSDVFTPEYETIDVENVEEVFQHTIKGEIQFNNNHPYFEDRNFINRLMVYYQENEQYEECQRLMSLKGK